MSAILCDPVVNVHTGRMLAINAGLLFAYMTIAWIAARIRGRFDTVDIAWGKAFIVVAWVVYLQQATHRTLLVAVLVSIWGVRLAWHLWRRQVGRPDDHRYQELAVKWGKHPWRQAYPRVFLVQGALVWVVSLPIIFAARTPLSGWEWLIIVGVVVWLKGFITEMIADYQLSQYLKLPKKPKVLQTGLWRYSRHPNYYGELLQWWGIGLIALQASYGWIGLAGPLTLSTMIIFISGIPPIEKKRQKDAAYRAYQKRTSPLIPWPPKKS